VCLLLDLLVPVSVSVSVDKVDAEEAANLRRLREPNIVVEVLRRPSPVRDDDKERVKEEQQQSNTDLD
jgi:hypothetical protein